MALRSFTSASDSGASESWMVRIQVIKTCLQSEIFPTIRGQLSYLGKAACANTRIVLLGTWLTDYVEDSAAAEDRVDEHRGVEGHAPAAQALVAGLAVLSAGCRVPR